MNNIINTFLDKIALALSIKDTLECYDKFDEIETFFLNNYESIEKSNFEIAQLGFDLQTAISELDSDEDNIELFNEIENVFNKMVRLNTI